MSLPNVVHQPSDYQDAIKSKLEALLAYKTEAGDIVPFSVVTYSEFGKSTIINPSIFIEVTKAKGTGTKADGRVYEVLDVALHSVFPNSIPFASKLADNSSFDIREIIILDTAPKKDRTAHWRWELAADSVTRPENVDRMPSIFMSGNEGYEGWCVSFVQEVTYGKATEDEVRESMFFAFNDNADDIKTYQG